MWNMMNYGWGVGTGWDWQMMIFGWVIGVLVVALLVLLIIWLIKQIQGK